MPPKTRRAQPGAGAQATLSFKNKITKAGASQSPTDKKAQAKAALLSEPAQEIVTVEIARQSTPEPPQEQEQEESQSQINLQPSPSSVKSKRKSRSSLVSLSDDDRYAEAHARAENVSDAQIKKYWKAEEEKRIAPRAHQQTLSLHEKILRHFDLVSRFGPCTGITRHARWRRAYRMKQDPPIEVLAVILKEEAKPQAPSSGAFGQMVAGKPGAKKREQAGQCGRLAYVDELMGGKLPVSVE